jgi:carboxypeptidase Taq
VADALAQLEERLGKITDLERISRVLSWDQQTMMPPAGSDHRAEHLSTLRRLSHELLIDDETGRLLDELRPLEDSLEPDSDDASLIRVGRRQYEKASRVPTELRAEMTRVSAQARPVWVKAKAESNFELFLPVMERTVELRRRYVDCFDGVEEPYDILLDDFEYAMTAAEVRAVFDRLKEELVPLIKAVADAPPVDESCLSGPFPVERQEEALLAILRPLGFDDTQWRLDPTAHPFASYSGLTDIRITTRYLEGSLMALFAGIHEFGHGLYEHQSAPELDRTVLSGGVSLGLHESQSRLWENLVGRGRPFWRRYYEQFQSAFPDVLGDVDGDAFYRAVNRIRPSLIRVEADQVTYNMHVILRFELEQDILAGNVELRDLPEAWNARMDEYLGIDVPDDARGVLQDVHWSAGVIGYFPTYSLGNVMSVQIWEAVRRDLPDLDDRVEAGDFAPLRDWLRDRIHRHGRKFTPQETLERCTGSTIDPEPYLRYLKDKVVELYGV